MQELETITSAAREAATELLDAADLKVGQILVVGCSTSEIAGETIGSNSSEEIAEAVMEGILPVVLKRGVYLAVQCCEHLNRALVVERECAEKYGYEIVAVSPWLHAGGAFAVRALQVLKDAVVVETLSAHAGMDIGDTFIGMHLRHVAVPVRSHIKNIGKAHLTMAKTRAKYIGGPRAHYNE